MRPLPPRWPRRTVLLTIAALAALALPPTAALAVDGIPAPPGPSQRAEGAASAPTQAGPCEAELTIFTREGVAGEAHAVALTAQAMDRDTDGWLLLAWQAADGTHLTHVLATAPDGTTRHLDPTPTGTVEHVTTLTFCGTHTTPDTTTDPAAPSDAAERGAQGHRGDSTTDAPDDPPIVPPSDASTERPTEAPAGTPTDRARSTDPTSCDDPLVAFSREGVAGEAHAVALTAQAMDRDTDGWLLLAWQAADGTHLTHVLATAPDGTTRHLDPTPTGTVEHVTTLTFCGTHTTPDTTTDPAAPSDAAAATAPATPADPTADASISGATPAPARDGEHGGQDGNDGNRAERPRTTSGDDGEVEVLGVQLVSPLATIRTSADQGLGQTGGTAGEEARTLALAGTERSVAGLHLWLLIAAVGAGLAAAGTLVRARTQPVTTTNTATTPDGPEAGR